MLKELRSFLSNLKHRFKVICITETRLHDVTPLVNVEIDGYVFEHTPTSSQCGGTGIYISEDLDYDKLEKLSVCHQNISESTFIEIKHKNKKNIIVGSIYRHHSEVSDFLEVFLRPTLEKISNSNKTCIFAGDFNVDLIKYGNNTHSDEFFDEVSGFSFRPLILQPSRINNRTFTLIDNIFINDIACSSTGGNITSSISDHLSQFSFLNILQKKTKNAANKI